MITPGLFNLHTHLPMTLFRGVVEDVHLQTWLFDYILHSKKMGHTEFRENGCQLAVCEAIRNGVTFVADMYYFEPKLPKSWTKWDSWNCRIQHYGSQNPDAENLDEAFENARRLAKNTADTIE